MQIYKTLPELKRARQMSVWHKALRSCWSPEDIDWQLPVSIRSDETRARLRHSVGTRDLEIAELEGDCA